MNANDAILSATSTDPRFDASRVIRAPRGSQLTCKNWLIEAAYRMIQNNLDAEGAIARQLRLRNLGGIVIADFIDMLREEHQSAVLAEFRKHLARDRVKTMAGGFSNLGLVEMTRKRTRESLAHMLCEPCAACQGKGSVKTARSVCYDILREILREARQFNPREFRVIASAAVVELFLDEESAHLACLSGEASRRGLSVAHFECGGG